ncbi:hypothetical protein TNIN_124301 [Trichonephila inaurata madagascariensis]|uniref:Uncharacterized protein n=1 Tax=Trichonephila inaurata madagascariensis TaxID=2747483 RepID=A0A8X6X1X4_9ARAC|nr:hypothetical protein TNIN_124301 [Trichonephila inaurata madagascariensis]
MFNKSPQSENFTSHSPYKSPNCYNTDRTTSYNNDRIGTTKAFNDQQLTDMPSAGAGRVMLGDDDGVERAGQATLRRVSLVPGQTSPHSSLPTPVEAAVETVGSIVQVDPESMIKNVLRRVSEYDD